MKVDGTASDAARVFIESAASQDSSRGRFRLRHGGELPYAMIPDARPFEIRRAAVARQPVHVGRLPKHHRRARPGGTGGTGVAVRIAGIVGRKEDDVRRFPAWRRSRSDIRNSKEGDDSRQSGVFMIIGMTRAGPDDRRSTDIRRNSPDLSSTTATRNGTLVRCGDFPERFPCSKATTTCNPDASCWGCMHR
jgi:hypothetical protein